MYVICNDRNDGSGGVVLTVGRGKLACLPGYKLPMWFSIGPHKSLDLFVPPPSAVIGANLLLLSPV